MMYDGVINKPPLDELYHFNKNHDPNNGQFTSGSGGVVSNFKKSRKSKNRIKQMQKDSEDFGQIFAKLEDTTRALTSGVKKGNKILVSTDTKKDYERQHTEFEQKLNSLYKKYDDVHIDIININGKDHAYVSVADKDSGYYNEWVAELKNQK